MAKPPRQPVVTYGADYILRAVKIVDILVNEPDSADSEETLWAMRQLMTATPATKATVGKLLDAYQKENLD